MVGSPNKSESPYENTLTVRLRIKRISMVLLLSGHRIEKWDFDKRIRIICMLLLMDDNLYFFRVSSVKLILFTITSFIQIFSVDACSSSSSSDDECCRRDLNKSVRLFT